MDPQIEHLLSQVARRYRSYRFAWLLTLLWCGLWIALALGILPLGRGSFGDFSKNILSLVWIGCALLVLWIVSRFWFRDLAPIAKRVEEKFPSLEQRLLTATSDSNTQSSAFLRRRLVQETIRHARAYDWTNTLASYRFWTAWTVHWIAFAALVAWIAIGFTGDNSANSGILQGLNAFTTGVRMTVEPGDVELERGSELLVTARFTGPVPSTAQLLAMPDQGSATRLTMTQALRDPVYGISVRNLEQSIRYQVVSGPFESPIYSVEIFEYPTLIRSDATIKPPAFASQPEKTIEDTHRVTVVERTELTWTCTLNKPIPIAELVNEQGIATPLIQDASNPTQYTATFVMDSSQRWQVRLVDNESRKAKFDEELVARVLPNQPPAIKVVSPADMRVSALQEVNVAATVTDDYGIQRAGLSYSLSDAEPIEIILMEAGQERSGKETVSHRIELEQLQAQPDQVLSYYFWIEDRDRDGNVRHVNGDMFFAEIRPFEELFRQGESPEKGNQQSSQNAGMAEELAETQKKIIAATWNSIRSASSQTADKRQEAAEILLESQQQARAQANKLSENIEDERSATLLESVEKAMDLAIEKLEKSVSDPNSNELKGALTDERAAYEGLLRLRARKHSIVQSQQSQSQSQSASQRNRQQQIEQLKLDNDENRYESESKPDTLQEAAQREMRQIMNRLDELARRQQDLNQQLRELDLALRESKDEEERKKLEEELRRLRDNQQELLRDTDETLERMNKEENREPMQEARQQMEEAREQMQQSNQAMSEQKTSSALTSGSRAQQTMEETRDTLRQQSSQGLEQSMRNLVQQAAELERQQQALQQRMPGQPSEQQPAEPNADKENAAPSSEGPPAATFPPETPSGSFLRPELDDSQQGDLEDAWKGQKDKLDALLDQVRENITESESSEPLLAEELYESYRKAKTDGIEQQLDQIPQLLQRGLDEPALCAANDSTQKIQSLREQIEKSSESILGSETESLRRALRELDRARDQLQQEIDANSDEPQESSERGESSEPDREPRDAQANEQGANEPQGQPEGGRSERAAGEAGGRERDGSRQRTGSGLERMATEAAAEAPLTGGEFNAWTDAIRDVEELVRDPELRAEAGRIREAAREMRIEYKRHSKEPEWPLVRRLIAEPMDQLRARISQDLLRKSAEKNQIVPIDRDPVPNQFQRQLNRYYENLGTSIGL